ncbi:MAG: hypothetical protein ACI8PZ_000272 [Myxococcota bacterium]
MNDALLAQLVPGLVVVLLCTGLGAIVGSASAILLIQQRRVPPVVTAIAGVAPALAPTLVALMFIGGDDPLAGALAAAGAAFVGGIATMGVVVITGVLLAVAGARPLPRRWPMFGVGLAGALVVAGLAAGAGYAVDNAVFGNVRALAYAVTGVILAAGMLGGGDGEGAGAEVCGGASLLLPLLVAAGESAERGLVHLILLQRLPEVPAPQRVELVQRFLDAFSPELAWGTGALVVASLVAVVGATVAVREGAARAAGAAAGALWLVAAFVVLWGPSLSEAALLEVVASMVP